MCDLKQRVWAGLTALFMVLLPMAGFAGSRNQVTVFAAASTYDALVEIAKGFEKDTRVAIRFSFASSATLARQIAQGAPAQVYLSANPKWMDYLEDQGMVVSGSRMDLLGNRLVLVAAAGTKTAISLAPGTDLGRLLGEEKLAMGDPDYVPAGIYGKQALMALGLWDGVAKKIARAKDVRAALALVAGGEAPLGIVYATDAAATERVAIAGSFPDGSHDPIIYPAALVAGEASAEAAAFLDYLKGPEASGIFKARGFEIP